MSKPTFKQANQRYKALFLPAMLAYSLSLVGGIFWIKVGGVESSTLRAIAGLAAGLPLVLAIWALMRFVKETDDFNRHINQQALAFAGGITASIAAVIGFLQMYEVVPMFPACWFVIIYFPAYGIGNALLWKGTNACGQDEV